MQFHGVGFICEVIIINQSNIRREDVRTRGNGDPSDISPETEGTNSLDSTCEYHAVPRRLVEQMLPFFALRSHG